MPEYNIEQSRAARLLLVRRAAVWGKGVTLYGPFMGQRDSGMNDHRQTPDEPQPRHDKEFQDFHYHDDEDVAAGDDPEYRRTRPPGSNRRLARKPPPRRPYYDD
ncbi:MAG TPA: hypothetical protein VK395_19135 [Gemmataceae bacterium]|nr:hypothetical protein [Gemmataceae bacterium]